MHSNNLHNPLFEGLEYKDLDGMMKPTIHVDEFARERDVIDKFLYWAWAANISGFTTTAVPMSPGGLGRNPAPAMLITDDSAPAMLYPATTLGLPAAMRVQPPKGSPRRAKARPLTNTVVLAADTDATCATHRLRAGNRCDEL